VSFESFWLKEIEVFSLFLPSYSSRRKFALDPIFVTEKLTPAFNTSVLLLIIDNHTNYCGFTRLRLVDPQLRRQCYNEIQHQLDE